MEATLSNSALSPDHVRALGFHHKGLYEVALAAKKKTDADFKNACKRAVADGIAVDDIKLLIKLETPEGEAELRSDLNRQIEVARWTGSPVGTQFSFLDEPDRTPLNDRAYEEGKVAGYKAAPGSPPYDGEAEQQWIRGYHDGQQTLMAALDLTKAGIEEIRAEEEAAAAEEGSAPPKKRGRPKAQRERDGEAFDNGTDPFEQQAAE